ncbi:MarR family transcriptional regulator [Leptospira kobayashii]|uniref:MarR family transcriptional regulator n=1 Tax=Leptospira kobayashii TaxID=1917830 RepID=A0ABM7UMG8_9LEPT|nr:MarR family transcriptional regulator [Leptospira kobayashii]BDA80261.1 MarR family transcriptional regulator [Leptospira kobayashii]
MKKFYAESHPGYLLKIAQHELRKMMDNKLKEIELTTPQYATLNAIHEYPGISNAEIARKSFITPQTSNLIIKNLVERNLIIRKVDSKHGRIQKNTLSEAGKRLLGTANNYVETAEYELFSSLSREEIKILTSLLQKILKRKIEKNIFG